jgi:hypothetical protein
LNEERDTMRRTYLLPVVLLLGLAGCGDLNTTQQRTLTGGAAGAAGGAIIGAIAGGKKGAAIGTAVGGGAGTGVVLATRGKEVSMAKGSALTLKLSEPVTIRIKA